MPKHITFAAALALTCGLTCAVAAPAVAAPATATPGSPHAVNSNFSVTINGVGESWASRVEFSAGADRTRHGSAAAGATLRITRVMANVTGGASEFLKWYQHGQHDRGASQDLRTVWVELRNAAMAEVGRIELYNCAAVAWIGPTLAANGSAGVSVLESVDLACQSVSMTGSF